MSLLARLLCVGSLYEPRRPPSRYSDCFLEKLGGLELLQMWLGWSGLARSRELFRPVILSREPARPLVLLSRELARPFSVRCSD